MKIAIIGYGKMGQIIEKLALERNFEIGVRLNENATDKDWEKAFSCQVAIEFTQPDAALANITKCLEGKLPVVVGTTGWYNELETVVNLCKAHNGTVFYASNYSVGVNILFHLNKVLAQIMDKNKDYQASIKEVHHIHKKDSPSGTGLTLANDLISNHSSYKNWKEIAQENATSEAEILPILAERQGEVPGIHKVVYESDIDTISIAHAAKGREGFASGALDAAAWVVHKKGVFTMNDMLNF